VFTKQRIIVLSHVVLKVINQFIYLKKRRIDEHQIEDQNHVLWEDKA